MSKKTNRILILMALFPLIVGLACLKSKPDPTATPEAPIEEVLVPEPIETEEVVVIEEPEPISEPGTSEGLVLLSESLVTQDEYRVYAYHIVENRSTNLMYEDVSFKTSLFDASGGLIDQDTQIVSKVFPGQKVGLAVDYWQSDDDEEVDHVKVDWTFKRTSSSSISDNPLSPDDVKYWENDGDPMVTGWIYNSDSVTYTDIRVSFICYNHAGDVVGGGMEYLDFVHDDDYIGFSLYVDVFDDVEAVDVFPYMSWATEKVEVPDPYSIFSVEEIRYRYDDFDDIIGGFVIKNQTSNVYKYSYFHTTCYDENEYVTATGSTFLDLFLPGDTLGLSPYISTQPDNAETNECYVDILPGKIENDYEISNNPFEVLEVTFADDSSNDVLVKFTNTYNKSISSPDIYVLAYDADGDIIGGNKDWISDPIAAGETIEHEVWLSLYVKDTIAEIKAWVTPSILSDFK